jgi:TetR/AcrR family transcriptional regulator, cholesterol catabolism regulator
MCPAIVVSERSFVRLKAELTLALSYTVVKTHASNNRRTRLAGTMSTGQAARQAADAHRSRQAVGDRRRRQPVPNRLREKRAALVDAVTPLLIEKGFHRTSVRDIAEAVRWSMGALYLYIDRKEDVLHFVCEEVMEEFNEELGGVEGLGLTATDSLREAMRRFFLHCDRRRSQVKLLYRESASMLREHLEYMKRHEMFMCGVFERIISRGIAEGCFAPVNPQLLAHDIVVLGHTWALKGWSMHTYLSIQDYIAHQTTFVLRALCADTESPSRPKMVEEP